VVAAVDPKGNVQRREHDLTGRIVRLIEPDGNVRDFSRDAEGNVVRARDRHYEVSFAYRGLNCLVERTQAGTTVRFEYDTEERLVGIVNQAGRAYRFRLDPVGGVEEEVAFDGPPRRFSRDLSGRVVREERPSGATTAYRYDALGRVVLVERSDGAADWYAYRPDGLLSEAGNATTAVKLERDLLGRVIREAQGKDWVESVWDARGLRAQMRSSRATTISIERNAAGDVVALRAGGGAPSAMAAKPTAAFDATFVRDSLGHELERALPGGVRARWERDQTGRPLRHEVFSGTTWKAEWRYTWEANDRLRQLVDATRGTVRYTHDPLANLASTTYEDGTVDLRMPDAIGNLFRSEERDDRRYGTAGELLESRGTEGITHYKYDADGNLTEKAEPRGNVWHYVWNAAGRLARVIRPDGWVVEFAYDPLGRRVLKKFRGQVTRWVWDVHVPLHEWTEKDSSPPQQIDVAPIQTAEAAEALRVRRDAELATQRAQGPPQGTEQTPITWLFEPETFAPIGKIVGDQHFGIVTDHLGTPVRMFDAEGRDVWAAGLDAYGGLRFVHGDRDACPFRWPGQYEDPETGLYYNRFRYYDPHSGNYASRDPVGIMGGLQLYAYVYDPLIYADPLGLTSCKPPKGPEEEKPLDWSLVSKKGETRAEHVGLHGTNNLQKPSHGVFYGDPVATTNDAWSIGQRTGVKPTTVGGVDIHVIPRPNSGYSGGFAGQGQNLDTVTIITQQNTNKIITAYPGNGLPAPQQ
jgi:RHS repeat-associated protein